MSVKIGQYWRFNFSNNEFIGRVFKITENKIHFKITEVLYGDAFEVNSETWDYQHLSSDGHEILSSNWTCLSKLDSIRTKCSQCH